ncbi:MAG: succinate dehydrogenase cytochrome b subunit [Cytophagales bacterium]|nr:succinate dehydrogenase cytochrome b subunit [Cytophagales bacterium]
MSWFSNAISSTLGRKLLMALTGLFLISFLVVHLIGNLQLLANDGGESFNLYAKFMTTNPVIKTTSYLLYATFIIHIVWAILLSAQNRKARTVRYAVTAGSTNSSWTSRNMGILGTIILVFLIIHLKNFWYEMHWGGIAKVVYDGVEVKDLYTVVEVAYTQWWYVAFYVAAMVGVMFHLFHGFKSAFQTLGLNHPKYNPVINTIGTLFSIIVPGAFAAIPIIMYVKSV